MSNRPHIEPLTSPRLVTLSDLLSQCAHLPLSHLPGIDAAACAMMQAATLLEKSARGDVTLLGAIEGGVLRGLALLQPLPWDSGIFGVPMGRLAALHWAPAGATEIPALLLEEAVKEARRQGWRHMDFQPHVLQFPALNAAFAQGFGLVSTTLALVWDLTHALPAPPAVNGLLRAAIPSDADEVGEAAARSVDIYSRFCCDPELRPDLAPRVFQEWAANSARGYADRVCVAQVEDRIAGFCTWKTHRAAAAQLGMKFANLDLTCVVPEARGQHLLTAMMHEGLAVLASEGYQYAEVVTHVLNAPMQRAAHQFGARALSARHSLHWHA